MSDTLLQYLVRFYSLVQNLILTRRLWELDLEVMVEILVHLFFRHIQFEKKLVHRERLYQEAKTHDRLKSDN